LISSPSLGGERMKERKIYIAGSWTSRERLRLQAIDIEELGHHIVSSWLIREEKEQENLTAANKVEYSNQDLDELTEANLMILDTQNGQSPGKENEFGFALCLARDIWIVGPELSMFHSLANRRFKSWGEVKKALGGD
jgi:hypothetical protein